MADNNVSVSRMGQLRKVVRLVGEPWSNLETCERVTIKIIGVLANSGYTLSMPINIDTDTRVYFFIRDPDEHSECVKVRVVHSNFRWKDPDVAVPTLLCQKDTALGTQSPH